MHVCLAGIQENHEYPSQFENYLGNPGLYKKSFEWENFDMKLFGSRLFGQAIKAAGVGGALMLSVSVSHSQPGPFAGFNGSWSGNGTVALSDGKPSASDARPATMSAAPGWV